MIERCLKHVVVEQGSSHVASGILRWRRHADSARGCLW
jgi:hypothetical protein